MAKNPRQTVTTKKHLARIERERIQTRYLLIGSLTIFLVVILLIGYGILDQVYLQKIRPVSEVNGEKITTKEFQALARYNRQRLVNSALEAYNLIQYFGNDVQTIQYIANQLAQINYQLEASIIGQDTLDILIDGILIRQEAFKRGISVSQSEIDQYIQEAFDYFPMGTPTPTTTKQPISTATLSATQYALVSPTPTSAATATLTNTITETLNTDVLSVEPTDTPTELPTQSPTPYTEESFEANYQRTLQQFKESIEFTEEDFINLITTQIYREKLKEIIVQDMNIPIEQEQVWARHILVNDEQLANDITIRLEKGEDWTALAKEYSTDPGTKDTGGDLDWFSKGSMVAEFESAAFELDIGKISQPVQSQYGWHIIQTLGRRTQPFTDSELQQEQESKFADWLSSIRENAEITIDDTWINRVPTEPTLPAELIQYIDSVLAQQNPVQQIMITATQVTP